MVVAGAATATGETVSLPPGTYDVSERPAAGTDGSAYTSSVACRRDAPDRGRRRVGAAYTGLALVAGDRATCTFYNLRNATPPPPVIAIRKTGPEIAVAGDTLEYTLWVTNPGAVAFPADAVDVTDPRCDDRPVLESKGGDSSPETLDPGDSWRYGCSRRDQCGRGGLRPDAGRQHRDGQRHRERHDRHRRGLDLDDPAVPERTRAAGPGARGPAGPQPPLPSVVPGPVAPPGPRPPNAGDAAVAGLLLRQAVRGCIGSRIPRVNFRGTRIAGVRISINGRPVRSLTLNVLQRRARPRVTLAPGTYRISARVRFQNGSGTPAVTLARRFRICRPPAARCSACFGRIGGPEWLVSATRASHSRRREER